LISKESDPFANGISQLCWTNVLPERPELHRKSRGSARRICSPETASGGAAQTSRFCPGQAEVEKDYIDAKAGEMAQAEAKKFSEDAAGEGIEKAAQKLKLAVKTSQNFKRDGQPDPDVASARNSPRPRSTVRSDPSARRLSWTAETVCRFCR